MVPMYEAQPEKEWEFIARDCEAKVLVVANDKIAEKTKKFLGQLPALKHVVTFEKGEGGGVTSYASLLASGKEKASIDPSSEDVAALIYTSGTTGNPKGVILSHGNIVSNINAMHDCFPMATEDRSLSFLPWAHSFGQTVELHALFSMGGSLAICEAVDKIIEQLAEVQPTVLFSVPRVFNKLYAAVQKTIAAQPKPIQMLVQRALAAKAKERRSERISVTDAMAAAVADKLVFAKVRARFGGRLKYAFSGGAAISREVAEFIDSMGVTVYEGYGLTETSPIATANWPGHRKIGSVGTALPGVKILIDTSHGVGEKKNGCDEGEIIVRGPNVMQGYHNRKEENDAVFTAERAFRTGDMGYLDPDGYLYITGRIKEQYKLENGKYVAPAPLEEQLKLSPLIANAMVYGDNKPFNVALVVANVDAVRDWATGEGIKAGDTEALLSDTKVRARFQDELAKYGAKFKGYEGVKDFALIAEDFTQENGMLTPSLKVKRRKVIEKWGNLIDGLYAKKKSAEKSAASASN
jgi:long-chain acyl-CoA synthetase